MIHGPCFRAAPCPWEHFVGRNGWASVLRKKTNVDEPRVHRRGSGGVRRSKKKKISEKSTV